MTENELYRMRTMHCIGWSTCQINRLYSYIHSIFSTFTSSSFLLILMQVTAPLCSLRASFITCPFGVTSHILTWPSPPPLTTRLLSDVQASAVTPWKKTNHIELTMIQGYSILLSQKFGCFLKSRIMAILYATPVTREVYKNYPRNEDTSQIDYIL